MDQVDKAIAASGPPGAKPQQMHRTGVVLNATGGRTIFVDFPVDMTMGELLEFSSWVPTGLYMEIQKLRNPASKIEIARSIPPRA